MRTTTLIIGLFICSLGFGQDRMISDTTFRIDITQYAIHKNNTMIYLLLKYKEECYNDSSYVCGYVYDSEFGESEEIKPSNLDILVLPHYEYECIWTHKQPTFDGFIEWIEQIKNKY